MTGNSLSKTLEVSHDGAPVHLPSCFISKIAKVFGRYIMICSISQPVYKPRPQIPVAHHIFPLKLPKVAMTRATQPETSCFITKVHGHCRGSKV